MAKRKRASIATAVAEADGAPLTTVQVPLPGAVQTKPVEHRHAPSPANPNERADILDAPNALRASPDGEVDEKLAPNAIKQDNDSDSPLSDVPDILEKKPQRGRKPKGPVNGELAPKADAVASTKSKRNPKTFKAISEDSVPAEGGLASKSVASKKGDVKESGDNVDPEAEGEEEADEEEIKEALHPLRDPSQPEHATKNRPDREQPADITRGMQYVENICLTNARDIPKMVRWNDKYGIKFMRLSSEMFPFASHEEYGYKLAPFASDTLAEAGKVIAELGHRVTTHPGQFTQLGSPRKQVIDNAMRDLEYHDEMLSLLKLPPQENRDAVMILHMGGVFGSKTETLSRFRENYAKLSQSIKNRLVLENDDVSWSLHDLLPVCEELNIPFVLDFHHHNIIFDSEQIREGTKEVMDYYPRILKTWERKGITPKMHYSEPTPAAITGRQRRKHNPRVATLPPCPDTMDLMIEAKDKEQAVFELMRTFKLPGYHLFNDIIPHVRKDDNKSIKTPAKKKTPKKKNDEGDDGAEIAEDAGPTLIPEAEVGMGGPDRRVYWPPGMEDWLRPPKRVVKKKDPEKASNGKKTPKKRKNATESGEGQEENAETPAPKKSKATPKPKGRAATKGKNTKATVPTPSISDEEDGEAPTLDTDADEEPATTPVPKSRGARKSARATRVSYAEADGSD
ncbi:MAG: hypothetical protein Q9157_002738 [Trypethelium eluteriae]